MVPACMEDNHVFTGREKLITSLLPSNLAVRNYGATNITSENLAKDLCYQFPIHFKNRAECEYLINYYKGNQPILRREVKERTDDSHTVINFAQAISRNISSYTYSGGVQYVSSDPEYFEDVKIINDFMKREGKEQISKEVQDYQSICGTAFMSILPDSTLKNDVPYELTFLSPVNTFVVYSCFNTNTPVYACTYFETRDFTGETKYFYQVYTDSEIYIYKASDYNKIGELYTEVIPHELGNVPIIEFPNNAFRMGDFEPALSLLNSINSLSSDCLYNIQSVVTSYLALFGVDLENEDLNQIKENRILVFPGTPGINQDAKFIHVQLDGTSTEFLRNYLESSLKFITGIPDRDSGQTGSDTGAAAELRTGQGDLEVVAKTKALYASTGERRILEIALNILYPNYIKKQIPPSAIDIEITRINRADMLTKTQAMLNLNEMGFEKSDVVFFGNITNDVAGVAKRWKDNLQREEEKNPAYKVQDDIVNINQEEDI